MTGGDFYALSDDQLARLLAGELPYAKFLFNEGSEKPREVYSKAEPLWYELSQVLQPEAACGVEQTDKIPEMVGFSSAQEVQAIALKLAALADPEILKRCEAAMMEATPDQVVAAVHDLKAFFQRAASNQDAVLFRVT